MLQFTYRGMTHKIEDEERQPCEVWTRVMGYMRPVANFNIGKKQEHKDRVYYKVGELCGTNRTKTETLTTSI
jgi:anaerobic ribonucleoside-triphosphate reductase